MAAPHHGRRNLRALLGHLVLQMVLFVADGPDNDRRRVAIALDHRLQLRQALGVRTHLPRLAHHHHAHAVAAFHPLRRGHIVRGAHRVAAHLAQHPQPEPLQPVRHRRAHSGMVLVVAGALNLQRFAVEEESLVGIEDRGAHAKADPLGIARLAARLHRHNRRVEIRRIHRPQRRIGQVRGRRKTSSSHPRQSTARALRPWPPSCRRRQESASSPWRSRPACLHSAPLYAGSMARSSR